MPKRSSKPPQGEDTNETAFRVVREATGEPVAKPQDALPKPEREKNPAAVALGRLGGQKGGKARAEKLSSEERSAIAKRAAAARWTQKDK